MAKKILLVDDDRINTALVQFSLKQAELDIVLAFDGQEGLAQLDAEKPDLVVLDVQMPNMTGFEFMREMKSNPDHAMTPVIMLTANDNMQEMFYSEGVKDYFVKPVDLDKLKARVKELLGS